MPSGKSEKKHKKRQYPFSEEGEARQSAPDERAPSKKKPKQKESEDGPGFLVLSSEPNSKVNAGRSDAEEEDAPRLLDDDKKEISDLLDDIEERKRKKREKRALRRTNPPTSQSSDSVAEDSIKYLRIWHENRSEWKYKTAREGWLIRHWADTKNVCNRAVSGYFLVPIPL